MKIYSDIEQGTPEWLQLRVGKFTASDATAIANNGKGLETLCFAKAAEAETGKPAKEEYTNEDIERGKELESLARDAYELETGIIAKQVAFVEKSERVGCSPDGLIEEDGLLEIKCKNDANFVRYRYEKKIDPSHYWQMQMQLLVTEREYVDYAVFNPNFAENIIIVRVPRNEDDIEKIRIGLETGEELLEKILAKI